ncbi:18S rRNA biogenesis protein RCL1 [Microbotryum lychnidis-dioicae p1A1 Lamole]|uniref:18S rRNA biogenesis protein RCL1 n=1 Tax=Microbotryum lychnidis-dioicae (strain p1A1 Lamole / MvSl-1064) TaxID=683840 RepID=U5HFK7_USTV1|nr:18S rRNA biogenesis protein RCL1 [Microbotryum lychnidis-dioicae p1A1 Lamole]|eukprot:KDE03633.1 18S rRNA biogenesis protein RCL1 [Microbotryum lychnidis-dioicae p1A1 Lamole]
MSILPSPLPSSYPPPHPAQSSPPCQAPLAASSSTMTSTPVVASSRVLHFKTHSHLRHRLILSLLSRRPIRIDSIRSSLSSPGLRPYEVSFLRLIEKITQGSRVEISYTGTSILFHPGTLSGGSFTHQCAMERSIGWYLEPLLAIAPFGKSELRLDLKGTTTDGRDASVDTVRVSGLPHLTMFMENQEVELRILKRGHPPLGGGQVIFACPIVRSIKSGFDFTSVGRINKIRGIAHSVRVSPQLANRLVASARSVLNRYIPDVYIHTDVYRGEDSGKSPGYALTLVASSTSQVIHSTEASSCPPLRKPENWAPPSPEELGVQAAQELLEEIRRGGCVDRGWEWLVTLMLVLGGEDVGKCTIAGPFDAFFIEHLRDLKAFFGTTFKIKPVTTDIPEDEGANEDENEDGSTDVDRVAKRNRRAAPAEQYTLSCVGTGYTNTARKTTVKSPHFTNSFQSPRKPSHYFDSDL